MIEKLTHIRTGTKSKILQSLSLCGRPLISAYADRQCRKRHERIYFIDMRYTLAVFDLDGTILNTIDDLTDSTNHALVTLGFPPRTLYEVNSFVGNGIHKLIERAVPQNTSEHDTEAVFREFADYYKSHCDIKTKPYAGIEKLLLNLRKAGCKTAVVSNKADFAVKKLCDKYFPSLFDVAVGEKDGIARKPAPDTVNTVLKELGIAKENAVYIGDSDVDIQTAANANMDCISVSWGFRDTEFLKQSGAKIIADKPKDIENMVLFGENVSI